MSLYFPGSFELPHGSPQRGSFSAASPSKSLSPHPPSPLAPHSPSKSPIEFKLDRLQINLSEIEAALREISGQPPGTPSSTLGTNSLGSGSGGTNILRTSSSGISGSSGTVNSGSGPRLTELGRKGSPGSSPQRFAPPEGLLTSALEVEEISLKGKSEEGPFGIRAFEGEDLGENRVKSGYWTYPEVTRVPKDSLRLGINSKGYARFK